MHNEALKKQPLTVSNMTETYSVRKAFGEGLAQAGEFNEKIVALCSDVAESTGVSVFKEKFPNRYVEIGVAEQNLAAVASGFAAMGKIPFIFAYSIFNPGRNWEQIRTTICYNNRPVKIVGTHAGLTVGPDGGSHQALEDIALTRVLPRMTVLSPADANEARQAVSAALEIPGPVYIRLSRESLPVFTDSTARFTVGKAEIVFDSLTRGGNQSKIGIAATGDMVYRAILAAEKLSKNNIGSRVLNISTIKPLDKEAIVKLAEDTGAILTIEDHQKSGGMGSAVAELLALNRPVPMEFVGVSDRFGQSGEPEELLKEYGLDQSEIISAAVKLLRRKGE